MKLITIKEAQDRLSVGRTTLWALCKRADFPKLVELTAGRKAFVESEIYDWIAARLAARDAGRAA